MIIGVCGRVAAGKEALTQFLRDQGIEYHQSSDMIKDGLDELNMEITRENMQNLADEWRGEHGAGVLMKKFLEREDRAELCIIDSLRNAGEVDFMREKCPSFILIGVDAPQKIRFERMLSRGKPSDPKTWEEFLKMDKRDNFDEENPMGQQTGKCLEAADFVITNDSDLDSALKQVEEIWEKIRSDTNNGNKTAGMENLS
jgi:dephospho-CoA kinase